MLGLCHEFGHGTTKSYEDARRLYERALALGHAQAAEALKRLDQKIRTECPLLGKRVSITGTSREDLNGRTGVTAFFDQARGRYVVELDSERKRNESTETHGQAREPGQTQTDTSAS